MIQFKCKTFEELSKEELYATMVLRQEVFVLEQDCVYIDADGKDQNSWHLLGTDQDGDLVAYLRILPKGLSYKDYPSIGRVATSKKVRGAGAGKVLMKEAIDIVEKLFPGQAIKISAQVYIIRYYESFGFEAYGEHYLEDGIPHTAMIRKHKS